MAEGAAPGICGWLLAHFASIRSHVSWWWFNASVSKLLEEHRELLRFSFLWKRRGKTL
jgi:hypothetical protein